MIGLHKSLVVGLFVCLASAQQAGSQILQGGEPATQMGTPKATRTGNKGDPQSPRATPKESPQFCFQPGIGWQRLPGAELNGPGTPGKDSSGNIEANSFAAGGESKAVYAKPASAKPTTSYDCPEISMDTITPAAGVGDITTGNHGHAVSSARFAGTSAGPLASLRGTSLFNPASGAVSGRRTMTLGSKASGGTYLASGSEAGISSDPVGDLKSHAYISSIVLRRMMRTAPDLQTRIKLQELENKLSNKSYISTTSSKGKGRLNTHHDKATYSLPMSGGHSSATGRVLALSSRTQP